jgi:hypothetical protein
MVLGGPLSQWPPDIRLMVLGGPLSQWPPDIRLMVLEGPLSQWPPDIRLMVLGGPLSQWPPDIRLMVLGGPLSQWPRCRGPRCRIRLQVGTELNPPWVNYARTSTSKVLGWTAEATICPQPAQSGWLVRMLVLICASRASGICLRLMRN